MLALPEWAYKFIKDKECPYCGEMLADCILLQIGLKLRDEANVSQGCCLCFDARCNSCGKTAATTIFTDHTFNAAQIVTEIYNAIINKANQISSSGKKGKHSSESSKIPDREFSDIIKFMEYNDDYESFLKYIGISDWEIKKYKK